MDIQQLTELEKQLKDIRKTLNDKQRELQRISTSAKEHQKTIETAAQTISEKAKGLIDEEQFAKFFRKPYAAIPVKKNQLLVAVPKFIKNFQVGWLWKETDEFRIYQLDQYSHWLGDVPEELMGMLEIDNLQSEVIDGRLHFDPSKKDEIKSKLNKHLADFKENSARIVQGHEFQLIADLVARGTLPFKPRPVNKGDICEGQSGIKLRDYQEPAYKKFLECGAIGLFHPTGAGKSFVSLKILDTIRGPHLIAVPSRSLVEQWGYLIETHLPHKKNDIDLVTYQGFKNKTGEYAVTIYDECQRLPANTFSKLALIQTKYRVGLSASPHREDGRESYIFALTGFPVGLNWETYMQQAKRVYHQVNVHVVKDTGNNPRGLNRKEKKAVELVDMGKKTMIFSDSLSVGKKIADKLGVPFISGQSTDRIQTLNEHPVCVVSRVMDLGVSVKDLQHVVEVDFLFGSRQQELQRTGRLMHSLAKDTKHDIIMTDHEMSSYGKRLWSLQEKGFKVKVMEEE